jgi:hypothetical protein
MRKKLTKVWTVTDIKTYGARAVAAGTMTADEVNELERLKAKEGTNEGLTKDEKSTLDSLGTRLSDASVRKTANLEIKDGQIKTN